ncbi:hypothetical protein GY24_07060 [Microterricola pindariensis]|uniref:GIY-YIG catalytic domain-containing protein n=2 Tax=Microterricola pindariensis TaxID=478010 RepID=A0ABX5AWD1_9MICO|nr:hypothetical protein GY24_07060 [Microterricola pindariensis]
MTPHPLLERLLEDESFRSAGSIDGNVPDAFGLYAIRLHRDAILPEPFGSELALRASRLLYLGEARTQTLRGRLLGNEPRARGHGTFFRSLGAVLGYRPPLGSLLRNANQRNYRFAPADEQAIVEWINTNLDVSWVTLESEIHANEVALIREHTPLLNLEDNPRPLLDLKELRALCCRIAGTRH